AKAGTHTPRRASRAGLVVPALHDKQHRWLWVPAFAGTTPEGSCGVASAEAGDPVRRGLSVQAQTSLEYWIARPSRATTLNKLFDG
ncbi:hypothetical protein, partial [Bradyrhizobium sp. UBA2491]|uniref:hypothetical protein n=1 Tax=Bradyrhizobium sp. UBA2491 TaxID=1946119 RepID=UPI0025BC7252